MQSKWAGPHNLAFIFNKHPSFCINRIVNTLKVLKICLQYSFAPTALCLNAVTQTPNFRTVFNVDNSHIQGSQRQHASPMLCNNADRHLIKSNRLLQATGKSILLREGVMGRSLMTAAAEPLYMHHYVKTASTEQKYVMYCNAIRRTKRQMTCTENFINLDVVIAMCKGTDRQTR